MLDLYTFLPSAMSFLFVIWFITAEETEQIHPIAKMFIYTFLLEILMVEEDSRKSTVWFI